MFADAPHSASPRQPITGIINIIESSASTNDAGKRYKTYRPQNSRACLSLTTHRISQQINVGGDYLEIPTWRIKVVCEEELTTIPVNMCGSFILLLFHKERGLQKKTVPEEKENS